jgi:hypothetical protein
MRALIYLCNLINYQKFYRSIILQYIWGLLNDMSFLTILTMVSIAVPGIAKYVQAALLNFIYLDLLKTDKWLIPLIFPDDNTKQPIIIEYSEEDDEEKIIIIDD